MTDFFALIGIGISSFIATDIDDIFVLMLFFSTSNFRKSQIVIGQYLGIGLLVVIGTLGSIIALVVPHYIVGLLGLVPISIGVIKLVQLRKNNNSESEETIPASR